MTARAERLLLDGVSPSVPAGRLVAALFEAFGTPAEAISTLRADAEGVWVTMDAAHARAILTPSAVSLAGGARAVLRRPNDLDDVVPTWSLRVETSRTAGELCGALYESSRIAGEDVGIIHRQRGAHVSISLPRWRVREADLPLTLDGRSVVVEKKNFERLSGNPPESDTAESDATGVMRSLELLLNDSQRPSPSRLAQLTRTLVDRTAHEPILARAHQRLVACGFNPKAGSNRPPALVRLTLALADRDRLEAEQSQLCSVALPGPDDLEAERAVELLLAEREGRPVTGHAGAEVAAKLGLMTCALGTLCPGARARGMRWAGRVKGQQADLWDEWCAVCEELLTEDGLELARLRALDGRVRSACEAAGVALESWPALMALAESEAAGAAAGLSPRLDALAPDSAGHEAAALRRIDSLIRQGKWTQAGAVARRALQTHPDSVALARRVIRLTGRTDMVGDDDTSLLLAAEAAWQGGRRAIAESAFLAARPAPGSPAANHAAMRLGQLRRNDAAWGLVTVDSPATLRLRLAVAAGRWEEAATAWASVHRDELGLLDAPEWADAAVLKTLGDEARGWLTGQHFEPPKSGGRPLFGTPEDAAALIFETPGPSVALTGLASTVTADNYSEWRGLILHLLTEAAAQGLDIATLRGLTALIPASGFVADLLRIVGTKRVLGWLVAPEGAVRTAGGQFVAAIDPKSAEVREAWSHTGEARLANARQLLLEESPDEARHIALAVARRARRASLRQAAIRLILDCNHPEQLESSLALDRAPGLISDVLQALCERAAPLTEGLRRAVEAIAQSEQSRPRLRAEAKGTLASTKA